MLSERNRNLIKDGMYDTVFNRIKVLPYVIPVRILVDQIIDDVEAVRRLNDYLREDLELVRHLVQEGIHVAAVVSPYCTRYTLKILYKTLLEFEDCLVFDEAVRQEINIMIADEVFSVIGD